MASTPPEGVLGKNMRKAAQPTPLSQPQTAGVEWAPALPFPPPAVGIRRRSQVEDDGVEVSTDPDFRTDTVSV